MNVSLVSYVCAHAEGHLQWMKDFPDMVAHIKAQGSHSHSSQPHAEPAGNHSSHVPGHGNGGASEHVAGTGITGENAWLYDACPTYRISEQHILDYTEIHDQCITYCARHIINTCLEINMTAHSYFSDSADATESVEMVVRTCAHHYEPHVPHRASVFFVPTLVVFYTGVVGLFSVVYTKVRRMKELSFLDAKSKGLVDEEVETPASEHDSSGDTSPSAKAGANPFGHFTQAIPLGTDEYPLGSSYGMNSVNGVIKPYCSFMWIDEEDPRVIVEMGLDGAMYMAHMRLCVQYCLFQFFTIGVVLIAAYMLGGDTSGEFPVQWYDMYAWSYGNLLPQYRWITVVGSFWMTCSAVVFVGYRQKVMNKLKAHGGHSEVRSTHTLWFQDVRPELSEREIKNWFDSHEPGEVQSVQIALDVHDLAKNVRAQRRLITRMNFLDDKLAPLREAQDNLLETMAFAQREAADPILLNNSEPYIIKKLETLQFKLSKLIPLEPTLRNRVFENSGHVFVTFTSEEAALRFRAKHDEGRIRGRRHGEDDLSNALGLEGVGQWELKIAPMPAEIYWENMGLSWWKRLINTTIGLSLTAGTFSLFIGLACVLIFFIAWDYFYILYGLHPKPQVAHIVENVKSAISVYIFYIFGGFGALCGLLAFEEFMAEIVSHFSAGERPVTQSRKQESYMTKAYWFYIIYHLVLSTVAFYKITATWLLTEIPLKMTVDMWGLFHMNRALLTCAVVDPFHMLEGIGKFRRPSQVITEEERAAAANSAEDEEDYIENKHREEGHDEFFSDHFDFTKNYGETLAIFTVVSYYGVMHPLIMPVGALYFKTKHLIDKYQITRQYSKANVQYGGRVRSTSHILLISATVGQIGNVWYFLFLQKDGWIGGWMCASMLLAFLAMRAHLKGKKMLPAFLRSRMKLKRLRALQSASGELGLSGENSPAPKEFEMDDKDKSRQTERDGVQEDTRPERVDFVFRPPQPNELRVGVEVYYKTSDRSPSFAKERYGNDADYVTPR